MQGERLEIVYRVRSASCLYFEGFSSELQMPLRVTSVATVRCDNRVYIVPRIPGRELLRALGVEGFASASDLLPPCDWLEALGDKVVDAGDMLELRFISFVDRFTGMPVRCYTMVVKPGVVFEGRLVVEQPCGNAEEVKRMLKALKETLIVGGLRLAGCGFIEPVSIKLVVGGEELEWRDAEEVLTRLCGG